MRRILTSKPFLILLVILFAALSLWGYRVYSNWKVAEELQAARDQFGRQPGVHVRTEYRGGLPEGMVKPFRPLGWSSPRELQDEVLIYLNADRPELIEEARELYSFETLEEVVLGNPSKPPDFSDDELAWLTELSNLRKLTFYKCELTDASLPVIARLATLTELEFHDCRELKGDRLTELASLKQLKTLNLDQHHRLENAWTLACELPKLERFTVDSMTPFGSTGFFMTDEHFSKLDQDLSLEFLPAEALKITDKSLTRLNHLPRLDTLDLRDSEVTSDGLKRLTNLQELRYLRISGLPITDKGLAMLAHTPKLVGLFAGDTLITDEGLRQLEHCPNLQSLGIGRTSCTGEGLAGLIMPELKTLHLYECPVTPAGLAAIGKLPAVEAVALNQINTEQEGLFENFRPDHAVQLQLSGVKLDRETAAAIAKIPYVESLEFSGASVQEGAIAELAAAEDCRLLNLGQIPVTVADLEALITLPKLTQLRLNYSKLEDAHLKPIGEMKGLVALNLNGNPITDAGVQHLTRLSQLKVLNAVGTNLADAAIDSLSQLTSLEQLYLTETEITNAGVKKLQESLPQCTIRN